MKKTIFTAIMLFLFITTSPVLADKAKHTGNNPTDAKMSMSENNVSFEKMRKMREMMTSEMDPAKRQELMRQHMQMMHDGMSMMNRQNNIMQGNMMNQSGDMAGGSSAAMAERMKTMEKHMKMMQEMMQGMMTHQKIIEENRS